MTDLERRALLGDWQAQEEYTNKGLVLSCPYCGNTLHEKKSKSGEKTWHEKRTLLEHPSETGCFMDGLGFVKEKYLGKWNTRPAPPIGRCEECAAYIDNKCANTGYYKSESGFCDDFKSKDGDKNAM